MKKPGTYAASDEKPHKHTSQSPELQQQLELDDGETPHKGANADTLLQTGNPHMPK